MTGSEVAGRLMGALGGSRNLDAEIYELFGYDVKREPFSRGGGRVSRSWCYFASSRWIAMLRLTSDVGEAISFCESHFPGSDWHVATDGFHGKRIFRASMKGLDQGGWPWGSTAVAGTPALALAGAICFALAYSSRAMSEKERV